IGVPCNRGVNVNGGTASFTWTATGLPPGMSSRFSPAATLSWIAPGDLELWGRPTMTGTFNVQVSVPDATVTTATSTCPFKVSPMMQTAYLQNVTLSNVYAQDVRVIGGAPSYVASQTGLLPSGLTVNASGTTVTGTPGESGNFNPLLTHTDTAGQTLTVF